MSRIVYKLGITKTAATLAEHGAGLQTGHKRYENGREYVLVQNGVTASGTIGNGLVCAPLTGQTTVAPFANTVLKVNVANAATEIGICVNNTGAVIPGDHFFWGLQKGRGYGLGGGAIGDGIDVVPGTAGIIAANAGATGEVVGVTISDVSTNVDNAVFWEMPSKGAIA